MTRFLASKQPQCAGPVARLSPALGLLPLCLLLNPGTAGADAPASGTAAPLALPGPPTVSARLLAQNESLDDMFALPEGEAEPAPAPTAEPEGLDDMFALPEGEAEPAPAPAADPEGPDDMFALPEGEAEPAPAPAAEPEGPDDMFALPEGEAEPAPAGEPESLEDMFALPEGEAEAAPAGEAGEEAFELPAAGTAEGGAEEAESMEALFGLPAGEEAAPGPFAARSPETRIFGFFQSELAYIYSNPGHWEKFRQSLELGARGRWDNGMRWTVSGRVFVDPVFTFETFYPSKVRRDRQFEGMVREAYVDASLGDWELRIGRQNVIWGEMIALFFADVVSARDLREFVLQDFDWMRIPQWAVRAEYFEGDFHLELLWIPYFTYDDIGVVGDDYFPFRPPTVPGFTNVIANDRRPGDELSNGAYGLRGNYLVSGWDMSAFYYTAPSLSPAFGRSIQGSTILYQPQRNREHQIGATLAKDFGPLVMKGEMVYTTGRLFETATVSDLDGVSSEDFISYIVSAELVRDYDTRFTVQLFQQRFFDREPGVQLLDTESGVTLLFSTRYFHPDVEPEVIYVSSLDRNDSMLQAKVTWDFRTNWRAVVGADVFTGEPQKLFGRFDDADRVYTELRFTF